MRNLFTAPSEGMVGEKIRSQFFSLSFIAIAVGVAGFISTIITMFVDTEQSISIKWIIFICWIFTTTTVVLIKLINDLMSRDLHQTPSTFEKPIKLMLDRNLILIRKNELFLDKSIVGCYCIEDDFESIAFIATVSHVQDKFMQIKIISDLRGKQEKKIIDNQGISSLIIRPNIPNEFLSTLGGHSNE
jgi:hypothetical protein